MPYVFTTQQQAKIDQLYKAAIDKGATAKGAYAEVYQHIADVLAGKVDQAAGVPAPVTLGADVQQVQLWFAGAARANAGEGPFSTLIREYTQKQAELRGKGRFSDVMTNDSAWRAVVMKIIKPLMSRARPNLQSSSVVKFQPSLWHSLRQVLIVIGITTVLVPAVYAEQSKGKLTPAQEARRKCPLGPYDRCGELVGAYLKYKGKFPPTKRKIGGFDYLIPTEYFQNLDPTGYSNQLTAYWIPLSHFVDGREVAGTLYARDAVKYGLMWPYGVRIKIQTNPYPVKNPNSHSNCTPGYIAKDPYPLKMAFDMTMYRNRLFDNEKTHGKTIDFDACFVSDDPKYTFYPGVPVTYRVHPHNITGGDTDSPNEERAVAKFTIRDDKVYVEYMFQTAMFPYWKEIHRAVLQLIQSWEQ